MSDNNQSKSYVESATDLGQRAVNTVTGGGSSQSNDGSQNSGTWDQTVGSAKESLGNVTGSENLRRQGIDQNNAGKEAEARGHLQDLGQSATDRAQGAIGSVGAAVKGDREEEEKWRKVHDEGKGRQKDVEDNIEKRF